LAESSAVFTASRTILSPRTACHGSRMVTGSYLDLPSKDGQPQPDVLAKWAANAPLAFIDQSIGNLRSYRGIAMDVGDQDGLRVDSGKLHDALDRYGIVNALDVYAGTPSSKVADRFQNHVMPFFNQNLCF
jgi:hypothetical protein